MPAAQRKVQCQLRCGHVALLEPDSARRRPGSASRCWACSGGGSSLFRDVLFMLELLVVGLGRLAFECALLPGLQKRFDIFLVDWGIAIEVDGPQHFFGSIYGFPAEAQFAWDRFVDAQCQFWGLRLVRLHYLDVAEWAATVQAAMSSQQPVVYTSSYKL